MYKFLSPVEFTGNSAPLNAKYDMGVLGRSYDTRGNVSRLIVREGSHNQINISYDHDKLQINLDETEISLKEFFGSSIFSSVKSLLIDSTNLNYAEIASIVRVVKNNSMVSKLAFIYCEPDEYNMKVWNPAEWRGFELTESFNPVGFLPTYYNQSSEFSNKYLLAFLGFEDIRFSRMIDPDLDANYNSIGVAFSVPPFQTGFDTHSFMANSRVLKDNQIEESFFVAGNQPYNAYKLIEKIGVMCKRNSRELVIAPIGTKPTAIASVLAAVEDPSISIVFDFPKKRNHRSNGIGKSHLFPIVLQ